jgi:hypothetical protein
MTGCTTGLKVRTGIDEVLDMACGAVKVIFQSWVTENLILAGIKGVSSNTRKQFADFRDIVHSIVAIFHKAISAHMALLMPVDIFGLAPGLGLTIIDQRVHLPLKGIGHHIHMVTSE